MKSVMTLTRRAATRMPAMTATKVRLFMTGSVACMFVGSLERVVEERTDLSSENLARLQALVDSWEILADLSQADLVLWLPTWNAAGYVAAAMVRPTTAPTSVPDEIVGTFLPRGRLPEVDRARVSGLVGEIHSPEAIAVPGSDGRVIAVIARQARSHAAGLLQQVYEQVAGVLFGMLRRGEFPPSGVSRETSAGQSPRVGDGLITLDAEGRVNQASPNAVSALRRLGLATDPVGADLSRTLARLMRRPGPVDAALPPIISGRRAGFVEVDAPQGSLVISSWPLLERGRHSGAVILVRDVTDLRSRDRALLSKDAALREAHHRVKNNLQTVAALLRLQARRVHEPEAQVALAEAGRRVGAIAAVHDILAVSPAEEVELAEMLSRLVELSRQLSVSGAEASPQIVIEIGDGVAGGGGGSLSGEIAGPIAMAVSELLANAVEHSGAGLIRVEAHRQSLGANDEDRLVVAVIDDGVGFDPSHTSGLGLSIVRSLIEEDLTGTVGIERRDGTTWASISVPVY